MKNLIKSGMLAAALFLSGNAFAKDVDFSLSFEKVTNTKVAFKITNAQNVALYLYNDAQSEIYSEKVTSEDHIVKAYDLAEMPAGNYFLVAESNGKMERYKININNKKVVVDDVPVSTVVKPQFTMDGNKVKMYIPNITGAVNISVYDLQYNRYYQDQMNADGSVNMVFDLNPETSKNYIISVKMEGNSFDKIFSLK
ncbi:MAG: hypothetical protein BGO40_05295 [Chryseobacterium sp. 39-10]|nr:hypothetical protein [Chryseobacterium sp.]OJV47876.1 MAG: hypothetical protein BGO40_05295 [Chryseobacterium sp. 39-10]